MKHVEAAPGALRSGRYTLGVLLVVALISYLDRQILALLVGSIRHDLKVTDTQVGLLQGLAFSLLYGFAALPAGVLADRWNRRNFIISALSLWSAATVLCGFSTSFGQLFACRIGVGLGEACLGPAALSMIGDYFSDQSRGRAVSVYQMGLYVGVGGSLLIGGVILAFLKDAASVSVPALGLISSWKLVFLIIGAMGFLAIPLLLTTKEPPRRKSPQGRNTGTSIQADVAQFFAFAKRVWPILLAVDLMYAATSYYGYSLGGWVPTLFIRTFGLKASQAGIMVGTVSALGGVVGCLASGVVGDRWHRLGVRGGRFRTPLLGWSIAAIALVIFPLVPSLAVSLPFLFLALFANGFMVASGPAVINDIVPSNLRGKAMSLYFLGLALIGNGLGPLGVGWVNDTFFSGKAIRFALVAAAMPAILIGAVLCLGTLSGYDRLRAAKSD